MRHKTILSLTALGLFVALGVAAPVAIDFANTTVGVQSAEARRGRGADDNPATHDVGDDNGNDNVVPNQTRTGRGRR